MERKTAREIRMSIVNSARISLPNGFGTTFSKKCGWRVASLLVGGFCRASLRVCFPVALLVLACWPCPRLALWAASWSVVGVRPRKCRPYCKARSVCLCGGCPCCDTRAAYTPPSRPAAGRGGHAAMASAAAVKEALHVKAQRGGPQALRERASIRNQCRVSKSRSTS
jgi:hypothetical protein